MGEDVTRREVFYAGHVQGVGFRQTTCLIAASYAVTGYVENLDDGRVHLEIQGPRSEVDGCLAELERRMGHRIRQAQSTSHPAGAGWADFTIRT